MKSSKPLPWCHTRNVVTKRSRRHRHVRGENQPGKPFHRCVDPVHSDVLHPRCRFGIRGVWFGNAIAMDRRSGSLDVLRKTWPVVDSGHRASFVSVGVVRQDIRHGAGQSGRHHRHLPRIALSGVGHIPTCRRNRRAGCDSGFGTRPDRSGRRTRADSAPAATFRIRRPCRHAHVHAAAGRLACTRPVTPLACLGDGSTIKRVFSQAFSLLVVSIRRGTKLATAMEARGFGSDAPRSQARESKLHAVDWLFYAICIAVPAIALATAYYTGYWHWAFSNVSN